MDDPPKAHRCVEAGKMPAIPGKTPMWRGGALRARGGPGTAGVPPATGRRPAMDDRPKAHRWVHAGKMPAIPGKTPMRRGGALRARGGPGTAGVPPATGRRPAMDNPPKAHRWVQAGKMPAIPGKTPMRRGGSLRARGVPGTAGVPPATGRRPAMGNPPKAHRWVQAGKMPAIPGKTPMRRGGALRARGGPGSAGVPPATGRRPAMDDPPKAHRWVHAGKMPAIPGKTPMRRGFSCERGGALRARASRPQPAAGRQWTTRRRPTGGFMRARCPRSQEKHPCGAGGALRARGGPWERGRPARNRPEAGNGRPAEGPPVGSSGQDARDPRKAPMRSGGACERGVSWERGRPARNRPQAGNGRPAEGPPVGSSGQDARGPRKDTHAARVFLGAGASPASRGMAAGAPRPGAACTRNAEARGVSSAPG